MACCNDLPYLIAMSNLTTKSTLWHQGSCHCQQVTFKVNAARTPIVTLCNCSICQVNNYHGLIVPKHDFELLSGQENLTNYQFNTRVARHTFCKICGVKAFYNPRSHPGGVSINIFCLDPVPEITVNHFDGQHWEKNIEKLHQAD